MESSPRQSMVFFEQNKLVYSLKQIKQAVCEEAKNIFIQEMEEQRAPGAAQDFLISKGVSPPEAQGFIEDLRVALLFNLKILLKELESLNS
jgi:hypothetical protein